MEELKSIFGPDLEMVYDDGNRQRLAYRDVKKTFVIKYQAPLEKYLNGKGFMSFMDSEKQKGKEILNFLNNPFSDFEYTQLLSKKVELSKSLSGYVSSNNRQMIEDFSDSLLGNSLPIHEVKSNYSKSLEELEDLFFKSGLATNQTKFLRELKNLYGFKNVYNLSFSDVESKIPYGREFAEENNLPDFFTENLVKKIPSLNGFIGESTAVTYSIIDASAKLGLFAYYSINKDLSYGQHNIDGGEFKTVSFPVDPKISGTSFNNFKVGLQKSEIIFEARLTDHVTVKIAMPLFEGKFLAYFS